MMFEDFTDEQKRYLEGFAAGSGLGERLRVLPTFAQTLDIPDTGCVKQPCGGGPPGKELLQYQLQDGVLSAGKKLSKEEQAKREKNGLDLWDEMLEAARENRFPKGTDVFLYKFLGLFYVAPAQKSFMCRLRIPGGVLAAHQLKGVADLADRFGGGYADVTTRANLQIREIPAKHGPDLLTGLADLGVVTRGSGGDNVRNVVASPTAGIDLQEFIDTRPLANAMHHYILQNRWMYGLPRKFNISFDGGGKVSALDDTNDIGFAAYRVGPGKKWPEGVYFRLRLGGITGHRDFARDTGVMLRPDQCVPVAAAVVRAFIEHGDRTDRNKARLKYVLDRMGFDSFLAEVEKHVPGDLRPLPRFPLEECEPRPLPDKHGHIGIHSQQQAGLRYVGIVLPVGRMRADQMRGLAEIARRHGSGAIRLTVWQNLILTDIPTGKLDQVRAELAELKLSIEASNVRGGLVACTGNAGCKYAMSNTKYHATRIADHLDETLELDVPVNIHLTGCHHSCAQHYIGDIGLLATKVGDDMAEGYHLYVGGGYGEDAAIGRELYRDIKADDAPNVVERILRGYLTRRISHEETFNDFVRRHEIDALGRLIEESAAQGVVR